MAPPSSSRKRQHRRNRPEASPKPGIDAALVLPLPEVPDGVTQAFAGWDGNVEEHPELAALLAETRELCAHPSHRGATQSAYQQNFARFATWCRRYDLAALPATPITVCMWANDTAKTVKPATVRAYLAAVNAAHLEHGYTPPGAHPAVERVVANLSRRAATQPAGPARKAHPLQPGELKTLVETLPQVRFRARESVLSDSGQVTRETRDRYAELVRAHLAALLVVGWHSAHRVNVLLRAELDWLTFTDGNIHFTADREKSHDGGFASVLWPTTDPAICPVETLLGWLDLRARYVEGGCTLLFAFPAIRDNRVVLVDHLALGRQHALDRLGDPNAADDLVNFHAYRPAYSVAFRRLKILADKAGITPDPDRYVATHSTRRGVITALRAKGLDPAVIARTISGHASPGTVLTYDDSHRLANTPHPVRDLGL